MTEKTSFVDFVKTQNFVTGQRPNSGRAGLPSTNLGSGVRSEDNMLRGEACVRRERAYVAVEPLCLYFPNRNREACA